MRWVTTQMLGRGASRGPATLVQNGTEAYAPGSAKGGRVRALRLAAAVLVVLLVAPAQAANPSVRVLTANLSFAPASIEITPGDTLALTNLEPPPHNVVSVARTRGGAPLFASATIGVGETTMVLGLENLLPGSYAFLCSVHPQMRGILDVR